VVGYGLVRNQGRVRARLFSKLEDITLETSYTLQFDSKNAGATKLRSEIRMRDRSRKGTNSEFAGLPHEISKITTRPFSLNFGKYFPESGLCSRIAAVCRISSVRVCSYPNAHNLSISPHMASSTRGM
jgi:hypothetical protein